MKSLPHIIIHNSVSLDGSLTGFMPDMKTHYMLAGSFNPDLHLIGSETIRTGIEMFGGTVPPEEPGDFIKPDRDKSLPLWAVIDSGGKLTGLHHTSRRFEFCRDVVVLVSRSTPPDYISHLKKRNYDYISAGKEKVDLREAIGLLAEKYNVKTIMTDTGAVLGNLLLKLGLVSEISLLIHPLVIAKNSYDIFAFVNEQLSLELAHHEEFPGGLLWCVYKVFPLPPEGGKNSVII